MTEQRCPAMKFCFFSSLFALACALARLCADGALMHRMLPIPATHIHTYIVYPHQALHLWWSQKFKFTAKEKRDKMNLFCFIFRIFLAEVNKVCGAVRGVRGVRCVRPASTMYGVWFWKCQRLTRYHVFSRATEGEAGRRQLWEIWHLGASL